MTDDIYIPISPCKLKISPMENALNTLAVDKLMSQKS
jgi:hypothetical protein